MKCIICTLFEHHYHYGVAVFVNSLCATGYTGTIYAGYRGPLPAWAKDGAKQLPNGHWELAASPQVRIIFIHLETTAHFANYKPDFMLQLEALAGSESDALIYFDPDIVLNGPWTYVENWLTCGVAICEDVNSPVSEYHPRRVGWRRFFKQYGYELTPRTHCYVNSGIVGITWEHRRLLPLWQAIMGRISALLGGGDVVGIDGGRTPDGPFGVADCFSTPDQDALNAALEASPDLPVSILGREAMGFQTGGTAFPHALGSPKPWLRNYIPRAFSGFAPGKVDKVYWSNAEGPLRPFSKFYIFLVRVQLLIASAIGRVIKRPY
jgi:hypothetical protein